MAAEWYYSKEEEQFGPVSTDELKALAESGELLPTDLIWKEGVAEWTPAGKSKGLFPSTPAVSPVKKAPPPLVKATVAGNEAVADKLGSRWSSHKLQILGIGLGVAVLLTLIIPSLLASVFSSTNAANGERSEYYVKGQKDAIFLLTSTMFVCLDLLLAAELWFQFSRKSKTEGSTSLTMSLWQRKPARFGIAFVAGVPMAKALSALENAQGYDAGLSAINVVTFMFQFSVFGFFCAFCVTSVMGLRSLLSGKWKGAGSGGGLLSLGNSALRLVGLDKASMTSSTLTGKWIPDDMADEPIEFTGSNPLSSYKFYRGKSFAAEYKVHPDQRIEITQAGATVETWTIVKIETTKLGYGMDMVLKNEHGVIKSFKKHNQIAHFVTKTTKFLAEKDEADKNRRRRECLQCKWEPIDGNSPALQFTEDGALIRFDGFAARYSLDGKSPNEIITIYVNDTEKVELKVLSLEHDEMVLAGDGGSCHYKRGVSISDAEAKRRADEYKAKWKTIGEGALLTVGAIGVGVAVLGVAAAATSSTTCRWCGFTRIGLHNKCPNCGQF